jgi:hypothetical protein
VETLDDLVRRVFPDMPGQCPTPEKSDGQRRLLLSHIAESTSQHQNRRRRPSFRVRLPLGVALGLSLSGIGGGIGWAISSSSGPSASQPAGTPDIYTACAATTSDGSSVTYIVAGSLCGPGHLPEVGSKVTLTQKSASLVYCVDSGQPSEPQNMILVTDSTTCPVGYETGSPPAP